MTKSTRHWHDSQSYLSPGSVKYDNIVDDKDFAKMKSQRRLERLSQEGAGQSSGAPAYDFEKGDTKRSFDAVSVPMLALRQGKLDRADVDEIQKQLRDKVTEDFSDQKAEEARKEAERIKQERQVYIDNELGFKPSPNNQAV